MGVQLKRVAGMEFPPPTTTEPEEEAPDLRAMGLAQWGEMRAIAFDAMQRFGKGARLWTEKDWQWEEPDWDANPETWPPLAKLLWLHIRAETALSHAQFLSHLVTQPGWCASCHAGEERPKWARSFYICPDHTNYPDQVRALAGALFAGATVTHEKGEDR